MKSVYLPLGWGIILLSGCFSLGRDTPPERYYVLGGEFAPGETAPAPAPEGLTIGIRQVELAGYLESPLIVVRQGPHEIQFSEFHRWGEDVGTGVIRVVADHLRSSMAFAGVNIAPWSAATAHDFLLQIRLHRFEGVVPGAAATTGGEAHLDATWEILEPGSGIVLKRGTTDYRGPDWRIGDYDGLVTLLNVGLRELSDELVAAFENVAGP